MSAKTAAVAGILAAVFLAVAATASNEALAVDSQPLEFSGQIGVGAAQANMTLQNMPAQEGSLNSSGENSPLAQRSSGGDRARQAVEGLLVSLLALVAVGPFYGAARTYAVGKTA